MWLISLAVLGAAMICTQALGAEFPSPPLYPSFNAPQASAGIIVIAVPGATQTQPTSINAKGEIVGNCIDNGNRDGFIREPSGTIVKFRVRDSGNAFSHLTMPTGINDDGEVAGSYGNKKGFTLGFVRAPDGTITSFKLPGKEGGSVAGINASGTITGVFDTSMGDIGFVRTAGGALTELNVGRGQTMPQSINKKGAITGSSANNGYETVGFVRSPSGAVTSFHVGSKETDPASINSSGTIAGSYFDKNGNQQGFERAADGTIKKLHVSGTIQIMVSGLNDAGAIIGMFEDTKGKFHSFVMDAKGTLTQFLPSGSVETHPIAINSKGVITGYYFDKVSNLHGFLRTP